MADIKINLLPWREELREQKKQEFLQVLGVVVVIAALIVFGVDRYYNNAIDTQKSRNKFIETEIAQLEQQINQIKLLQQQRQELLERRKVIEELQGNRPIIVRLFDEMARQLSDNVFFRQVELVGEKLTIIGVAKSNNMISHQLRNFNNSDWFEGANVTSINASPQNGPQASSFHMTVRQSSPKKDDEEEE